MSYHRVDGDEVVAPSTQFTLQSAQTIPAKRRLSYKYGLNPDRLHTFISVAAGSVMCLFGYEQGVFGGIIVGHEFQEYFHHPSPSLTGFVTSVYDLGCFAGALLTLLVGERLGRKRMLIIFTIIMTTGILLQTGAHSMNHLLWGRFIAGIGNGGNTATAPVWHVETSHDHAKGTAVVKEMVVNVFGFVISNIITLAFSKVTTEAQWRFPLGIQLIFIVMILTLIPLLPESPRWLLARGRDAEAKAILRSLSNEDVEGEFKGIRDAVREEQAVQASWVQILRGGPATRRMLLGMLLQICQQLTGINVLCYYLPLVLHKSVGLPELASRFLSTGVAVLYMLATAASVFFIERLGRRPLLMSMAAAQAIAFLGIAISTEIGHDRGALIPGIVATVFITFYFLAFGFGWVATPWLYPAEVNALSMRTKGAALATACDWLFNYAVVQTTPIGIHYLHWGLYLVYAILNAAFVPIIYYFIVETAGKSLEQIDRWFATNPGWFVHKAREVSYKGKSSEDQGHDDGLDHGEESVWLVRESDSAANQKNVPPEKAKMNSYTMMICTRSEVQAQKTPTSDSRLAATKRPCVDHLPWFTVNDSSWCTEKIHDVPVGLRMYLYSCQTYVPSLELLISQASRLISVILLRSRLYSISYSSSGKPQISERAPSMATSTHEDHHAMVNGTDTKHSSDEQHVIIIGAGITGLLIAHGLQRAGISFSVYEAAPDLTDNRSGDWSLGIHWSLPMLEEILGSATYAKIQECQPDPSKPPPPSDLIPILNGATGETLKMAPHDVMHRVTREKFRPWLCEKLLFGTIHCNKRLLSISTSTSGLVTATFTDNTSTTGSTLIGADGPRSHVRQLLLGEEKAAPSSVPYAAKRIIVQYPTAEQALFVRSLHPVMAMAIHPDGIWSWIAVIDVPSPTSPETWKFQLMTSWSRPTENPSAHTEDLPNIQALTSKFVEPFKSANAWIPEGTRVYSNRVTYWEPVAWDNRGGRVTLAGDACHPMTFHRGQGVNVAIADVADFIHAIQTVQNGENNLQDAIKDYEAEMIPRGRDEVRQSKMNTEMIHDWERIKQSPMMHKGANRG